MTDTPTPPAKPKSGWLNLAVDYGPLVAFLLAYKLAAPAETSAFGEIGAVITGTVAFMIAAVFALAFSKWKFGRVSPMLMLSTGLIVGFGALTIWLRDERFIQIKPTAIYLFFGIVLVVGAWRGKALLKTLLGPIFEGVDHTGWLKLSRNWGFYFFAMAALNEVLRAQLSFEDWLWAKLWVFMPLSFLFTITQMPMLIRHGLMLEDGEGTADKQPPVE